MATDPGDTPLSELSAEEARRRLVRLMVRQDIDEHEEVYEALERE